MRNNYLGRILSVSSILCALSGTSCVNRIGDDTHEGTVPITFSTKIGKSTTKATEACFSQGDKVGLFAMLTDTPVSGQRYLDNLRLECGEGSELIPEKDIFYPEGDATLDFFSYHPYRAEGIFKGSSLLSVSVQTDQSTSEQHSISDFMTSVVTNIPSSTKPVELEYWHQFAKIKVRLSPQEGENADDMLSANPRIIVAGFKTQATYDIQDDILSDFTAEADIIPFGTWKKESDGTLSGKEFIVIPQTANQEQAFHLEWNGKVYTCPMPSITMKGNTECEISIDAIQNTSHTLNGIAGKIKEWEQGEKGESENYYNLTTVRIAALSFKVSDVYRVYRQGTPVAEICKEYLYNDGIAAQAIVAYPVNDEQTDLQKGNVLQLLNNTENVHGGTVNWDVQSNSPAYTPGTSEPIAKFYIDENNEIAFEKPADMSTINISSYVIRDIRNGQLQTYPIVKIGTQYWMKEDLQATMFKNGTSLPLKTELGTGARYFKHNEKKIFLYNGDALLSGELAPSDWKIPNKSDWNKLMTYIDNNASLLKTGTWKAFTNETVCPVNNLTGLSILPNGMYDAGSGGTHMHYNIGTTAVYWVNGDSKNTLAEKGMFLLGGSDKIQEGANKESKNGYYRGLSIRCIKE